MKLKYIIILLIAFAINAHAQSYSTGFSYSMGFGVSSMSDYISKPSFTGFSLEFHKFIKPNVTVGLTSGWNIFSQKSNETITLPSGALSGEQARYVNVVPILLNVSYYMKNKTSKFIPFFRAHVGTYYILQRFDIGVYTLNNYNWHFGVAPEIGFLIKASSTMDILVNSRYNYAFDSGTKLSGNSDNKYQFFSVNFGISYNR
jgi:hypothetical protein